MAVSLIRSCTSHFQQMAVGIPVRQLCVLCFALLCNAFSVTMLFPFMGFMVMDLGLTDNPNEVGYYAGYIACMFMLGRFLSSVVWGAVSDRYGRKLVILLGLLATGLFAALFGFSTSFTMALVTRFLAGFFNAIVGTVKTCVSEICTEQSQPVAMSVVTSSWYMGLILGPAVGGLIAQPSLKWPGLFPPGSFFSRFPYALPCLVCTVMSVGSFFNVLYYMQETLASKRNATAVDTKYSKLPAEGAEGVESALEMGEVQDELHNSGEKNEEEEDISMEDTQQDKMKSSSTKDAKAYSKLTQDVSQDLSQVIEDELELESSTDDSQEEADPEVPATTKITVMKEPLHTEKDLSWCSKLSTLCRDPLVVRVVGMYCLWSLATIMLDDVYSLWCLSDKEVGGLGFKSSEIGSTLGISGVLLMITNTLFYPVITKRLGTLRTFIYGTALSVPVIFIIPFLSGFDSVGWLWFGLISSSLVKGFLQNMAYTSNFILINNSVLATRRGTVNGVAMSVASLFKAIGPASGSILFAWSVTNGLSYPLNHHFIFLVCTGLALATWFIGSRLPESIQSARKS